MTYFFPEAMQPGSRSPTNERMWADYGGGWENSRVTIHEAARVTAVLACTKLIADVMGSMPICCYDENRNKIKTKLLVRIARLPNDLMTAAEFWEAAIFNALLTGDAYVEIVRGPDGTELWPLPFNKVSVDYGERAFRLKYSEKGGVERDIPITSLFRFSGITRDGVESYSPVSLAEESIGMARALAEHGTRFFENAARPSGVLSTPKTLSEKARDRLAKMFNAGFSGAINAGKVPVLEDDFKFSPITATNTDSQFNELKESSTREIARAWRIPPSLLGLDGGKATSEQQALDFIKYTLRPIATNIEQAIYRDLQTPDSRDTENYKFDFFDLERGDSQAMSRNIVLQRTASVITVNQATERLDLPRINEEWADDPREPLNSNRAADTIEGGMTSPQDREDAIGN